MQDDLLVLADRTWGWDYGYRHLGRVAREAIRTHPSAYAQGVRRDLWRLVLWPLDAPGRIELEPAPCAGGRVVGRGSKGRAGDRRGADPLLARVALHLDAGRADPRGVDVADRPLDRLPLPARRGPGRQRSTARSTGSSEGCRTGSSVSGLVRLLNDLSRLYPRPFMWLLVGMAAAVCRRPKGIAVPAALSAAAFLLLVSTSLAVYAVAQYAVPVVPAFVVLATTGLLGRRAV